MQRGEIWWAQFDEQYPVVLLSDDTKSSDDATVGEGPPEIGFRAVQIVAASGVDVGSLGVEVKVGTDEGLPFDGVVRIAFPRTGFIPCTWITRVEPNDLVERIGVLSSGKVDEIDTALESGDHIVSLRGAENEAAGSALAAIREALRQEAMPSPRIRRG